MEILNKTIKKLTEEQYQELISLVAGKKKNKPFMVLETSRTRDIDDSEMMEMLQVNPSAYYTLKSRLNTKIASILSKNVQSPVNILMQEVSKAPAHLMGTNREFSIRSLIDLEKQLIEYDLSSELIVVYKTLAQLHLYTDDFNHYENLYKKHVAFALAVAKAEGLFNQFMRKMGIYLLTFEQEALEEIVVIKRELSNICEMYDSHRLFVIYSIVNTCYQCNVLEKRQSLKSKELEIEETLKKITSIFEKYTQDTYYQNIRFVVDFLYFEYYSKTGNTVRAEYYCEKIKPGISELCTRHIHNFYLVQFLNSKIEKFLIDNSADALSDQTETLQTSVEIDGNEVFHYVSFKKFIAVSKFYQKDFSGAARTINELRNTMSLKKYLFTDVECKLFQALQYCILGEDSLCLQIISSLKRQIKENEAEWQSTRIFLKLLKSALKPADYRKKIKRITDLWDEFNVRNNGSHPVLSFVKLDEALIRRMANPIKE
ncbi:MAG: hypothetical protein ACHQNT_09710 [Bacteroidia bacterium]